MGGKVAFLLGSNTVPSMQLKGVPGAAMGSMSAQVGVLGGGGGVAQQASWVGGNVSFLLGSKVVPSAQLNGVPGAKMGSMSAQVGCSRVSERAVGAVKPGVSWVSDRPNQHEHVTHERLHTLLLTVFIMQQFH